ncbi:MAG: Flp pilus assembly complex ATPase component TadA [Myxococcales bacterium]|nr:Flp pilus assembly complex ATPase component TadA [Myxococcales bacterium]MCB9532009.1 Flp pilus assembly complex ATPase component TadA [Myxococcales bacterium]MCB9533845.1 Flp pilus assembly complex ATPase component TadA [Myxococcales bacterium]
MAAPMLSRDYTVDYLAGILVRDGLLTERQRADVARHEDALRKKLVRRRVAEIQARRTAQAEVSPVDVILSAGFAMPDGKLLGEDRVMQSLAAATGLAYMKLDPLKLDERLITETMSRPFARRHVCLPVRKGEDGVVTFAIDNPFDAELKESLRRLVPGLEFVLSSKTDILRVITDVYGFRKAVIAAEAKISTGVEIGNLEQLVRLSEVDDLEATDKHVVSAVEFLLRYAFDQRASDIHIEPKREEAVVRLRIDGVLHTIYRMPIVVHRAIVSRLKTLARMDISERRRPQDGRVKTSASDGRETELRVSSVPVAFGEKLVLRVFDPQTLLLDLEQLGFFESELGAWNDFSSRSHGLVLITGPTGSGKTTTLYSTLRMITSPEVNVTTIEDPIELVSEAFNQILVQPKIGVTFAAALRNVLRQDPDVIMVGEIRDAETAEMAVQAALTGHLVFSTLHTNDAPSAVTRLQDLGVPNFLIASTLVGVMAQRLVRKICEHCKKPTSLTPAQAGVLGIAVPAGSSRSLPIWYGEGCSHCRNTGFYGRTGVFEVMTVDAGIQRLIAAGAPADELRREAVANGMVTLRDAGIRKLALGLSSFDEIVRTLADQGL